EVIPCSKLGFKIKFLSAGIANRARSWRRPFSWLGIPIPRTRRSTMQCLETYADAGPTTEYVRQFIALRKSLSGGAYGHEDSTTLLSGADRLGGDRGDCVFP